MRTAVRTSPERRLSRKSSIRWTGLCLWLAAVPAGAVGLGDMLLTSPPGQPLEAEIPLELVTAQELWALQVGVAPERTFLRSGLDRTRDLDDLRFEIVRDGDGGSVVRMTSPNPLVSSMTVLVEATWVRRPEWPAGRLVRIYSFGPGDLPATRAQPRPVGAGSLGTYGPVQDGETLWSLAERLRAPAVHTNQILVAIFEANPRGFGGNMNGIYQGATLRIPEAVQARRLTVQEATAEAIRQIDAWLADLESRGQPVLPAEQGETALAVEATPGTDELQAELEEARRLIESRDEQLQALRTELMEAQAAAEVAGQAAEELAAALAAALPPVRPTGLRGVWSELSRVAEWGITAVVSIGAGALVILAVLVGFLVRWRRMAAANRRRAEEPVAEADDSEPPSGDKEPPPGGNAADTPASMDTGSQLDLARSYVDMGEIASAKKTLQGVIAAGDADQREQAAALLASIESQSDDEASDPGDDNR